MKNLSLTQKFQKLKNLLISSFLIDIDDRVQIRGNEFRLKSTRERDVFRTVKFSLFDFQEDYVVCNFMAMFIRIKSHPHESAEIISIIKTQDPDSTKFYNMNKEFVDYVIFYDEKLEDLIEEKTNELLKNLEYTGDHFTKEDYMKYIGFLNDSVISSN